MATKIANLKSSHEDIIRQKWGDFSFAEFTVTTITNAPQQSNCFDCGVFVINWLEGRQRQYLNDSEVFIFIKLYFKSYIYLNYIYIYLLLMIFTLNFFSFNLKTSGHVLQ